MADHLRLPKSRKDMLNNTTSGDPSLFPQAPSLIPQAPGTSGTPGTEETVPDGVWRGVSPLSPLSPLHIGRERESRESGEPVVIEPAIRPDGSPLTPMYWERSTGEIVGPATLEFLAQTGSGLKSTDYWVVVKYEGRVIWIRSDFLRSQQQFETQIKPIVVDPIKDLQ